MTIRPTVRIAERKLVVKERTVLTNVSDNVVATSSAEAGQVEGVFFGAVFDQDSNRHVVSLGTLRGVRFLACFRFKLWWMAQKEENKIVYTVFLPLIEGPFKSCLQGNDGDELELCLESGDSDTLRSTFTHSVYISSGTDLFGTIHDAIKAVKLHLGSFRLRNEKKLPGIVDYFGWCTWDAFYQEVTQEGVEVGLESLKAGGTPPKFVIIDNDGVKVDAQCILETLGASHGGKVELTKQYHQALDASVARNFPDNGCIACMSHNLESLY
ncbi:putative galactinol--sucrose galactosyltransferase 6 [Sesamum alatum]|uniref:Galactinol--sucrose galactosyltransferase 6 n=1 Tax=Sesamum alatum TaxID=300844 RepID=A0AAE1XYB7_9LAMI|nr:putative galactinol--sucrose galactosyltransferase 6 [Sesamum alatum]